MNRIKNTIAAGISAAILAAMTASCGGKTTTADTAAAAPADTVAAIDLTGQWYIENIAADDTTAVRPEEAAPGTHQYITFSGDEYSIQTNCNTISGSYTLRGDSITLNPGLMTEMACDNMQVEDILRRVLPAITTVDAENDTIVRLNGTAPAQYILLRKALEKK